MKLGYRGVEWIQPAHYTVQWSALNEHNNKPTGSVKGVGYLDHLNLLKKDFASWNQI
jgi:hypothetical protein